eukprot:TRINITY_DN2701_c0_g1_i1.p1 TRINITY_DN2701_c0_g1~~TRINITY_DN2701_c0_g1_i1.p1  ORF type:complete len:138 (-),score=28.61 TRINITY_DN2701_c0_g1_i1:44-457(-)
MRYYNYMLQFVRNIEIKYSRISPTNTGARLFIPYALSKDAAEANPDCEPSVTAVDEMCPSVINIEYEDGVKQSIVVDGMKNPRDIADIILNHSKKAEMVAYANEPEDDGTADEDDASKKKEKKATPADSKGKGKGKK